MPVNLADRGLAAAFIAQEFPDVVVAEGVAAAYIHSYDHTVIANHLQLEKTVIFAVIPRAGGESTLIIGIELIAQWILRLRGG
jgi:hypothetical protein